MGAISIDSSVTLVEAEYVAQSLRDASGGSTSRAIAEKA